MDIASLFGIIAGIALIISAILMGGSLRLFFDLPAFMMVCGGTIAATFLTFPFKDVAAALKAAYYVFSAKNVDPNDTVDTMIQLCELSRRKGIVQLSNITTESPFLMKAANLIADGTAESTIKSALRIEIDALKMRHTVVQEVFKKMAMYAPAFGMIGTLIGLVQMLSQLNDPAKIGHNMAVALLATFYGAALSNLVLMPVSGKLRARTMIEVINLEIMFRGAMAILDNNNPIIVYETLSSYIPAKKRRPMRR